ncbi:hypothetical protein DSL92_07945 [Billgrantia gudaonensis]|uniref:Uncharacterized protein n=1 Tax=Billgrantia gudaonensis TaxID=376427 RepID=A0A432JGZ8_9GAMM|nr:hypothetical protein DSL92_07945 [Halomonas gudaonensis]
MPREYQRVPGGLCRTIACAYEQAIETAVNRRTGAESKRSCGTEVVFGRIASETAPKPPRPTVNRAKSSRRDRPSPRSLRYR